MTENTIVTVRLPSETKDRLARLAGYTNRTQSVLSAEAIDDYVTRELAIVEAIERGRADILAGRLSPHDDVVAAASAIVDGARTGR